MTEIVRPWLAEADPGVRYGAARVLLCDAAASREATEVLLSLVSAEGLAEDVRAAAAEALAVAAAKDAELGSWLEAEFVGAVADPIDPHVRRAWGGVIGTKSLPLWMQAFDGEADIEVRVALAVVLAGCSVEPLRTSARRRLFAAHSLFGVPCPGLEAPPRTDASCRFEAMTEADMRFLCDAYRRWGMHPREVFAADRVLTSALEPERHWDRSYIPLLRLVADEDPRLTVVFLDGERRAHCPDRRAAARCLAQLGETPGHYRDVSGEKRPWTATPVGVPYAAHRNAIARMLVQWLDPFLLPEGVSYSSSDLRSLPSRVRRFTHETWGFGATLGEAILDVVKEAKRDEKRWRRLHLRVPQERTSPSESGREKAE